MYEQIKSFELGRQRVILADVGDFYSVATISRAGFFGNYSAMEDAEAVWYDQVQVVRMIEERS